MPAATAAPTTAGKSSRPTELSTIALDAMGGDHAPAEAVAGAAAARGDGVDVVLVGDENRIRPELESHRVELPVIHTSEVIEMGDDVAKSIREKADSSIVVCARMVSEGEAAGFVSAGSTGAAMAAAATIVGRLPGVLRPTIASIFPTPNRPTVLLDSGANPEVKPEHLVQFAIMGSAFFEVHFGESSPGVGLLNIGEEKSKGRQLEKDAYALLEAAKIRFVGNVEGRDVASDRVNVIVTDGFTGNVFLKTSEGIAGMVSDMVREALAALPPDIAKTVAGLLEPVSRRLDYENIGGAQLLGIDGVVVLAHGAATRVSIANALRMASDGAQHGLVEKIANRIAV